MTDTKRAELKAKMLHAKREWTTDMMNTDKENAYLDAYQEYYAHVDKKVGDTTETWRAEALDAPVSDEVHTEMLRLASLVSDDHEAGYRRIAALITEARA